MCYELELIHAPIKTVEAASGSHGGCGQQQIAQELVGPLLYSVWSAVQKRALALEYVSNTAEWSHPLSSRHSSLLNYYTSQTRFAAHDHNVSVGERRS